MTSQWDLDEDCSQDTQSIEEESRSFTTEDMEDLFRMETRRWLIENAERLFLEKCRTSFLNNTSGGKPAFKKQKTEKGIVID